MIIDQLGRLFEHLVPTPVVALKRSVSIAVDGGKSLSGLFEGLAKARVQTSPSATRSAAPGPLKPWRKRGPESFKRRAFSFGSFLFGGTKRKEHNRIKSEFLPNPMYSFYFSCSS